MKCSPLVEQLPCLRYSATVKELTALLKMLCGGCPKGLAEVQRKAKADNLPLCCRVATQLNEVSYYKQGCECPKSVRRQYITSRVSKSVSLGLTLLRTEPNRASTISLRFEIVNSQVKKEQRNTTLLTQGKTSNKRKKRGNADQTKH